MAQHRRRVDPSTPPKVGHRYRRRTVPRGRRAWFAGPREHTGRHRRRGSRARSRPDARRDAAVHRARQLALLPRRSVGPRRAIPQDGGVAGRTGRSPRSWTDARSRSSDCCSATASRSIVRRQAERGRGRSASALAPRAVLVVDRLLPRDAALRRRHPRRVRRAAGARRLGGAVARSLAADLVPRCSSC